MREIYFNKIKLNKFKLEIPVANIEFEDSLKAVSRVPENLPENTISLGMLLIEISRGHNPRSNELRF